MLMVSSGLGFYNLSVLLAALTADGRFSLAAASAAPSLFFLTSGLTGLLVAVLIERFDVRYTIIGGAVICAIALMIIGRVETLWHLYAAFVLFGVGFAASALLPATTLVTRWFSRRRSIAVAIATTGLSVGGVCLLPVSAWLITTTGLAQATPWLAGLYVLGIVPVAWLVMRPHPSAMGLRPDGKSPAADTGDAPDRGVVYSEAIRSRYFIGVTIAYTLVLMSQVGAIAHLFKMVSTRGEPELATIAVSLLAVCSMLSRLLGGWLASVMSQRHLALITIFAQGLALTFLAVADSRAELLLAVVCFGISIGNILMLLPLLLAEAFGVRHFGRIYSISQLVSTLGVACGPLLVGIIHDLAGGYFLPFCVVAGGSFFAYLTLLAAGKAYAPAA